MTRPRFASLLALLLALSGSCAASAAQVGFSVDVRALVNRASGPPVALSVNDGSVLRSGDRLQVRVKTQRGGYLYIIAYGSSHSALLLHPFSGNASDARIKAGTEAIIPAPGVYLPLDDRTGTEALYAILSHKPLGSLSGLMKRMEEAGGDLAKVTRIVRGAYPDARHIAFRHIGRRALVGVGPVIADATSQSPSDGSGTTAAPGGAGASSAMGTLRSGTASGLKHSTQLARPGTSAAAGGARSAPATPAAALLQGPTQRGVLSAEGSLIRALDPSVGEGRAKGQAATAPAQGIPAIASGVAKAPGGGTVLVGPGAPRPAPAGATPSAAPATAAGTSGGHRSFASKLKSWLGFGAKGASRGGAATTPAAPSSATTSEGRTEKQPSLTVAEAGTHTAQHKHTTRSGVSSGGLLGMIGGWFSGGNAGGASQPAPAAPANHAAAPGSPKPAVLSQAAARTAVSQGTVSPPPLNGNGSNPVNVPEPSAAATPLVAQDRTGVLGGEGKRIDKLFTGGASSGATKASTSPAVPAGPSATLSRAVTPVSKSPPPASGELALASAAPAVSSGAAAAAPAGARSPPSAELPAATARAAASTGTVGAAAAPGEQAPLNQATAAGALARAVVLVVTPTGSGAGAVIDHAGHVLTNWHVVHGYPDVTVLLKRPGSDRPDEGSPYSARVLRVNKFADLALLVLDHVPAALPAITLARAGSLHAGDTLHAIGRRTSGHWLDAPVVVARVKDDAAWYAGGDFLHKGDVIRAHTQADIDASGVPLLNDSQALVGLGSYAERGGGELYAVSVGTIKAFLHASGVRIALAGG